MKRCRCETQAIGSESWEQAHSRVARELATAVCRLAAANALLATVPGLCGIGVEEWQHRRRAHLANQPAPSADREFDYDF